MRRETANGPDSLRSCGILALLEPDGASPAPTTATATATANGDSAAMAPEAKSTATATATAFCFPPTPLRNAACGPVRLGLGGPDNGNGNSKDVARGGSPALKGLA